MIFFFFGVAAYPDLAFPDLFWGFGLQGALFGFEAGNTRLAGRRERFLCGLRQLPVQLSVTSVKKLLIN